MATIKGTTAVLKGKTISTGDNVIITDNLYTIADINNFFGASRLKIKLEKTAAATQFVETAANLLAVLEKVETYTGAVTATPAAASTAINDVAGLTTGVVTATILNTEAINATLLVSLTNVKPSDKISYTPTNAAPTEATHIVAIKKILPLAVLGGGVSLITGGSADVAALKAASNIVNNKPVTVTAGEAISAADANAIAKNSSAVTADVKAASAASLNSALKDLSVADALSLTVSGKSATAADLKALVTKIGIGASTVDVDGIETITGNATDVKAVLAHAKITVTTPPEIKVSGTISVVDANTIAISAKAGDVTAKVEAGTAASLNGALGALGGDDKLSLTVINNSDGSATDAAHLVALAAKTASKITVNAKAITGTETQILNIYIQSLKDNFTGLGNKAVTVTGGVTDVYNLNAILNATSGVVTATITDDIAVLKGALTDAKGTDRLNITLNPAVANAADLKVLDTKTALTIDATAITKLTGTVADIKTVLKAVTNGGIELGTALDIAPTGTISAADASTITSATTGIVTAEVTAGTAAALNKALVDSNGGNNALKLTVTGATAAASDLNGLNTKTTEDVNATAVKTVTGSLADLGTFYAAVTATDISVNASLNATINGIVTVADYAALNTLLASVDGKATATVTPSTASALAAAFFANGKPTDALTFNVVEERDGTGAVVATDAVDLLVLDNGTFVKVKVDATQITGTYDQLEHVYVSGKAGFSNLGNETVEVTGTTTAARVDSILKATTGVVTAAVGVIGAETAANLVSSLKNAKKNDALALEITSGSVANAADLKALDAKTTTIIDADSIAKLIGTAADVKTVLAATTGINLGAAKDIDVSGTISAADANTIALDTKAGVVTATVKDDTAAKLNDTLGTLGGADKLTLTVTGASANASDLNGLNGKTVIDVNAAAIKTVVGDDVSLATLYTAAGVIGLGNEAVSVTGEASAGNIISINTATTGLINVAAVNTALTADGAFALSTGLGSLDGITGLYKLNAADGHNTAITFSIADLLAANDSSKSFDFSIVGAGATETDGVIITNTSGWTVADSTANQSQYVFTKGSQTITINLTDIDSASVI